MPTFKVQFDYTLRKIYQKHKSSRNSKQPLWSHACKKVPLQIYATELRTGRRQPVGCLQSVVELNFGQQKIKLAARGQSVTYTCKTQGPVYIS